MKTLIIFYFIVFMVVGVASLCLFVAALFDYSLPRVTTPVTMITLAFSIGIVYLLIELMDVKENGTL